MKKLLNNFLKIVERYRTQIAIGFSSLFAVSFVIAVLVLSGVTRATPKQTLAPAASSTTTAPVPLTAPRHLDGVMVSSTEANLAPWAVMIDNHPDARPLSALSQASVVIEAPVEGSFTRFFALYPPVGSQTSTASSTAVASSSTTSTTASVTYREIGPVRSARPYFIEWALGWRAAYFHVGGSPEALSKIANTAGLINIDEFSQGASFWRDERRFAPHNAYTKSSLMREIVARKGAATSTFAAAWHFQDAVTSTERGDVRTISVPYGGQFSVSWIYNALSGKYQRKQGSVWQKDRDGSRIEADNVIVIKTESVVLDGVGRLRLRTIGSGEAIAYRDGKKFPIRWARDAGEAMRFETDGGGEFLLTRGKTWIEVTTDDLVFGGVGFVTHR